MAKSHPTIPPFPSHIDRFRCGDCLSGFMDDEGCFRLAHSRHPEDPSTFRLGFAEFQINLHSDDRPILEVIPSFFGRGRFSVGTPMVHRRRPNPLLMFCISRTSELKNVVIPHFERHPLHAKKSRDFVIRRQGVELLDRVARGQDWQSVDSVAVRDVWHRGPRKFRRDFRRSSGLSATSAALMRLRRLICRPLAAVTLMVRACPLVPDYFATISPKPGLMFSPESSWGFWATVTSLRASTPACWEPRKRWRSLDIAPILYRSDHGSRIAAERRPTGPEALSPNSGQW